MKTNKTLIRVLVNAFVAVWGMLTLLAMAGEDSPTHPVSDATFIAVKLLSFGSLYLLVKFCKYADKKGLM